MDNQNIMVCKNCGGSNEKNSKFCIYCGSSVVNEKQQVDLQVQQTYSSQQNLEQMPIEGYNQIDIQKKPRKFSFLIVLGIIGCFMIPIPLINFVIGFIILILYLINGNEETGLGKFLKVFGIIFFIGIMSILTLFGACMFLIFYN